MTIPKQVLIDTWKAETALLIIQQGHYALADALNFAEASFDNIDGDIETVLPQECIDEEVSAASADAV